MHKAGSLTELVFTLPGQADIKIRISCCYKKHAAMKNKCGTKNETIFLKNKVGMIQKTPPYSSHLKYVFKLNCFIFFCERLLYKAANFYFYSIVSFDINENVMIYFLFNLIHRGAGLLLNSSFIF